MLSRFHHRRRLALTCCTGIEELEGRTLLSITAIAFADNVLENVASKVELAPFVKDSDPGATLTYELVSTTTTEGGQVSINAATGLVSYIPAENSTSPDSFQYFATDTDGDSSAMKTVTLNLSSVAANPVVVSEVEGQSTIDLLIPNLPGAVQDSSSKPSYTFSNAQVANGAGGTVSFTDTKNGAFTYTPPSSTSPAMRSSLTTSPTVRAQKARRSRSTSDRSPPTRSPGALSRARMRPCQRPPFPAC